LYKEIANSIDNLSVDAKLFPHSLLLHPFSKIVAEGNSTAQNFVDFTEAEEDLVFRMHSLVGNRYNI
jgi:transcription factor MYB, plant